MDTKLITGLSMAGAVALLGAAISILQAIPRADPPRVVRTPYQQAYSDCRATHYAMQRVYLDQERREGRGSMFAMPNEERAISWCDRNMHLWWNGPKAQ